MDFHSSFCGHPLQIDYIRILIDINPFALQRALTVTDRAEMLEECGVSGIAAALWRLSPRVEA